MTRKKGKRQRRERVPGAGDWATAGTGQTEQGSESVSKEMATSAETFTAEASRVKELEAELAEWKARAAAEPHGESQPPPQQAAPAAADAVRLADLYQQTMSRLTVILASADLLAMDPRTDSSVRETAQEIRNQGNLLADIIKSFTLPPDMRKAE